QPKKESNKNDQTDRDDQTSKKNDDNNKATVTTAAVSDGTFAKAKNGISIARSKLKAHYTDVIASKTATAQQKAKANKEIAQLRQLSAKEKILQSLIIANGYKDALVSAQGNMVNVYVKTNHLSEKQVVDIIDLVKSHIHDAYDVAVTFRS